MLQLATVRLRKPTRIFTFVSRGVPLSGGDACIVRSDRGLEYGMCILPPADCSEDEAAEYPMIVVRKATYNDENNFRQLLVDEEKAKALCTGKVLERNLPMRFGQRRVYAGPSQGHLLLYSGRPGGLSRVGSRSGP